MAANIDQFTADGNVAGEIPKTEVELSVSARNLLDADILSKSDPMCVLYTKSFGQENFVEFGRTEPIMNTLNPSFVRKFILEFYFEERQELRFELYDIDTKDTQNLEKQDALGYMECTLGQIVSAISIEKPLLRLRKEKAKGSIRVSAEELSSSKEEFILSFSAQNVKKKGNFLRISRKTEEELWTVVHQTPVSKDSPNVLYKEVNISAKTLCNGDHDRQLILEVYEHKRSGSHKLLGQCYNSLRSLTRGPGFNASLKLTTPEEKSKKSSKKGGSEDSGIRLCLESITSSVHDSFLDFVQTGTNIQVTVAVDFTSSNGDPSDPSSRHYNSEGQESAYATAIRDVVSILEDYDSDKKIPALGFGAQCSAAAGKLEMFALNGNLQDMEVNGTEGVLQAYKDSLQKVRLHGPTYFSTIINHVASEAEKTQDGGLYHILLILTDGCINDMPKTKEAIVEASTLPLSIIIIGIGDEDFTAMNILDGDHTRLSHKGKVAARDIVQFVAFKDYNTTNNNHKRMLLSKAVLEEVPGQVTSFMSSRKIKPRLSSGGRARVTKMTLV